MKFKDYYEILGVARTATIDEIKKSYKKLAHQYHPDVTKDPKGEEKFKEIGEAYATLKDKEKRAAYDELGKHGAGEEFSPPPNWGGPNQHNSQNQYRAQNGQQNPFDEMDLADLFASFSTGNRTTGDYYGGNHAQSGQDYELSTSLSLEDANSGTTLDLSFNVPEPDTQGLVKQVPHSFKVRIPKGVINDTKMLLRGKGGKGFNGGANGNLYLNIHFLQHKLFKAIDHDLFIDLPITPWEAALGATVSVPTLQGAVNLKIPAGSKSGQKMRIAKRGLPKKHDGLEDHGDLFAIVKMVLPTNMSEQERELMTALQAQSSFNPRAHFAD